MKLLFKTIVISILIAGAIFPQSAREQYDLVLKYYKDGDYVKAYELIQTIDSTKIDLTRLKNSIISKLPAHKVSVPAQTKKAEEGVISPKDSEKQSLDRKLEDEQNYKIALQLYQQEAYSDALSRLNLISSNSHLDITPLRKQIESKLSQPAKKIAKQTISRPQVEKPTSERESVGKDTVYVVREDEPIDESESMKQTMSEIKPEETGSNSAIYIIAGIFIVLITTIVGSIAATQRKSILVSLRLRDLTNNRILDFKKKIILIGRSANSDLHLNSKSVSKAHARIIYDGAQKSFVINDLGGMNGTKVNGRKIAKSKLQIGDKISICDYNFVVENIVVN